MIIPFTVFLAITMGIVLVAGLIWFSFRIDNIVAGFGFLAPFIQFFAQWWWLILIIIFLITPIGQRIVKFLLSKIGLKI